VENGRVWTERWTLMGMGASGGPVERLAGSVVRFDAAGVKQGQTKVWVEARGGEEGGEVVWRASLGSDGDVLSEDDEREGEATRWLEVELREGNEGTSVWSVHSGAAADRKGTVGHTLVFPASGRFVLTTMEEGGMVLRRGAQIGVVDGVPVSPFRKYASSVAILFVYVALKLVMGRRRRVIPNTAPTRANEPLPSRLQTTKTR